MVMVCYVLCVLVVRLVIVRVCCVVGVGVLCCDRVLFLVTILLVLMLMLVLVLSMMVSVFRTRQVVSLTGLLWFLAW